MTTNYRIVVLDTKDREWGFTFTGFSLDQLKTVVGYMVGEVVFHYEGEPITAVKAWVEGRITTDSGWVSV